MRSLALIIFGTQWRFKVNVNVASQFCESLLERTIQRLNIQVCEFSLQHLDTGKLALELFWQAFRELVGTDAQWTVESL